MTYYWSIYKLPELEGRDRQEVGEIWKEASKLASRDPKYWIAFIPAGFCGGLGSIFGLIGAIIGGAIGGALSIPFALNVARPHIANVIAERENRTTIGENK